MTEKHCLNNIEIKVQEDNEKKYLSIVKIPKLRISIMICLILYVIFILFLLHYIYNN